MRGKRKGLRPYIDEVSDMTEDFRGGRELDELLTELDTAGVEVEEPKLEFDQENGRSRRGD